MKHLKFLLISSAALALGIFVNANIESGKRLGSKLPEIDFQSVEKMRSYVSYVKRNDEILTKKNGGKRQKTAALGFIEAYLYDYEMRAFPYDTIDWDAVRLGMEHAEQMEPGYLPGTTHGFGDGPPLGANWQFIGPTNLPVPYSRYFGVSPINGRVNCAAYSPSNPSTIYIGSGQGGIWKSTDSGVNWTALSDGWYMLQTSSIAIDPTNSQVIYVGTGDFHGSSGYSMGIMKSTDGGTTWTNYGKSQFGNNAVSDIIIEPTNTQIITIATGRGSASTGYVWRSTNGGVTWSKCVSSTGPTLPAARWSGLDIGAPDNNGVRPYYAAGGYGSAGGEIWRSLDMGATWVKLPTSPMASNTKSVLDVAASKFDTNVVYLLSPTDDKIYKSTNRGDSWFDTSSGFPNDMSSGDMYNWSQDTYDYWIGTSYLTNGSGQPTADVVYVGLIDVVRSEDGGASWSSIGKSYWTLGAKIHNDQHCYVNHPTNKDEILCGNDGGIYRWNNSSETWSILNKNLGITQFYKSAFHPTNALQGIGGTQDNATPFLNGNISSWSMTGGGDGGFCAINQFNPSMQFSASQNGAIRKTTNTWSSSTGITPSYESGDNVPFIAPFVLDNVSAAKLYAGTDYLYRYNTSTSSWTNHLGAQRLVGGSSSSLRAIRVAPSDPNRIYTGGSDGQLWMSQDGGSNWTRIDTGSPSLPVRSITYIMVNANNPNDIWVTLSSTGSGHLYRCENTTAGTRVWLNKSGSGSTGLPDLPANAIAFHPDVPDICWFVATDAGVMMTSDAGVTWENITRSYNLPNVRVNDLQMVPGTRYLMAATWGRGMWRLQVPVIGPQVSTLVLNPTSVTTGGPSAATVTLDQTAPAGGVVVNLQSLDTNIATVPATVTVPEGSKSRMFTVTTKTITATSNVVIRAVTTATQVDATLTVTVPSVSQVTLSPSSSVRGGASLTGTAHLYEPAPPGGLSVTLSSSNTAAATVPSSVTVPAGASSVDFPITSLIQTSTKTSVIKAIGGGAEATATLTVTSAKATGTIQFQDLALSATAPTSVVFEFRYPGQTTPFYTKPQALMAGGSYVLAVPGIPFDLSIKVGRWLRKTIVCDATVTDPVANFSLINGDIDEDNVISIFDYSLLSIAFDTNIGDPGYLANADLDGDGSVTIFDYSILSVNFDIAGDN